jgi:putative DNA primase/helicase
MHIVCTHVPGRKGPDKKFVSTSDNKPVGKPVPTAWSRPACGEETTTPELVFQASQRLVAAGLSIIPIEAHEGSKSPDSRRLPHPQDRVSGKPRSSWSIFTIRRPTNEELVRWNTIDGSYGLAIVAGAVSGGQHGYGLEVIDIDTAELAKPWMEAVERQAPGLINRLVRICTPRPGLHCYYRCSRFGVSQKLAFGTAADAFGQVALDSAGHSVRKTLIELKGEGGYCLIPPSPARCHPSCRLYRYADGSPELTNVPTITPEKREILLDAARSLDEWRECKPKPSYPKNVTKSQGLALPGDDFNARAKWDGILTKHGWTFAGEYGDETRWCRPGKTDGISATTNHAGIDLLHVFSSNAERFEPDKWYTKFAAYALLNHKGDFSEAARELREQGYGKQMLKAGKR